MPDFFPFRALLFDLDGTLVDSFAPIHSSFGFALESLGIAKKLGWNEMMGLVGTSLEDSLRRLVPEDQVSDGVERFREHYNKIVLEQTFLLPGALELLRKLTSRGTPAAVITNKKGDAARRILLHLDILTHLRFCLGESDGFREKPAPDMILEGLKRLGTLPSETLFLGDSPYDFHGARAAAVPIALLPTGTHSPAELNALNPDYFFPDLTSFSEWWFSPQGPPPGGT
ncbi:MAG: HAD family hydrolase [Leptospirales bacterium]